MLLPKNPHFRTDLEPQARLTQRKSGSWNNSGIKSFLAPVVWKNIDNWGSETVHHWFSSKRETLDGWTRLAPMSFRPVALDFDV